MTERRSDTFGQVLSAAMTSAAAAARSTSLYRSGSRRHAALMSSTIVKVQTTISSSDATSSRMRELLRSVTNSGKRADESQNLNDRAFGPRGTVQQRLRPGRLAAV